MRVLLLPASSVLSCGAALQFQVQLLEGLPVEEQVLLLAGSPLDDAASLGQCGVSEHCTLEVLARMLGG